MREIGLNRFSRFIVLLPVFACYALAVAFVVVLSSAMGGRAAASSVFISLGYTVGLAAVVCAVAVVPAFVLAVFLFRIRNARSIRAFFTMLETVSSVPLIVPAYLLMLALHKMGYGYSYAAVVLAFVIACLPRLSARFLDVMRNVPPQYYLAGISLGDGPAYALGRVVIKEARRELVSCVILLALSVVNELALVQIALGYTLMSGLFPAQLAPPTLALLVQRSVWIGDTHTAAMAAIALLAVDVSLCYISRRLKGKH